MTQIKDIAITKTIAEDGDFLIMQNPITSETYKITKANLLAGLSNGSGSSGTIPSFLVFASHFDSSPVIDIAGNTTTLYGTAQISSTITLLNGGALLLDGSGYLTGAYNSSYDLGSNDFTIDFFIRFSSLSPKAVINRYGGGSNNSFVIQTNGSGIDAYVYQGGSYVAITGISLNVNTNYYIGLKRSGNYLSLWVNGTQRGTASISGSVNSSTTPLFIGGENGGGYLGNFRLDDFRFYVGVAKDLSIVPTVPFS